MTGNDGNGAKSDLENVKKMLQAARVNTKKLSLNLSKKSIFNKARATVASLTRSGTGTLEKPKLKKGKTKLVLRESSCDNDFEGMDDEDLDDEDNSDQESEADEDFEAMMIKLKLRDYNFERVFQVATGRSTMKDVFSIDTTEGPMCLFSGLHSPFMRHLHITVMVSCLWSFFYGPFLIALTVGDFEHILLLGGYGVLVFDACVDVFFLCTLLLSLVTSYIDSEDTIEVQSLISIIIGHLVSPRWWVEVISCFPTLMLLGSRESSPRWIHWLELLKAVRAHRFFRLPDVFHYSIGSRPTWRLGRIVLLTFLASHVIACFWCRFGGHAALWQKDADQYWSKVSIGSSRDMTADVPSMVDLYLVCWVEAVYVTLSIGLPDPTARDRVSAAGRAHNSPAMFITGSMGILGGIITAILVSNVTMVVHQLYYLDIQQSETGVAIGEALQCFQVPANLGERVRSFHNYCFLNRNRTARDTFFVTLHGSHTLGTEMRLYMFHELILSTPFFNNASGQYVLDIIGALDELTYTPGDYIIRCEEPGKEMFFLIMGVASVIISTGDTVRTLTKGDYFGELALVYDQKRTAWIRANSYCVCATLSRKAMTVILREHPDEKVLLIQRVEAAAFQSNKPKEVKRDRRMSLGHALTPSHSIGIIKPSNDPANSTTEEEETPMTAVLSSNTVTSEADEPPSAIEAPTLGIIKRYSVDSEASVTSSCSSTHFLEQAQERLRLSTSQGSKSFLYDKRRNSKRDELFERRSSWNQLLEEEGVGPRGSCTLSDVINQDNPPRRRSFLQEIEDNAEKPRSTVPPPKTSSSLTVGMAQKGSNSRATTPARNTESAKLLAVGGKPGAAPKTTAPGSRRSSNIPSNGLFMCPEDNPPGWSPAPDVPQPTPNPKTLQSSSTLPPGFSPAQDVPQPTPAPQSLPLKLPGAVPPPAADPDPPAPDESLPLLPGTMPSEEVSQETNQKLSLAQSHAVPPPEIAAQAANEPQAPNENPPQLQVASTDSAVVKESTLAPVWLQDTPTSNALAESNSATLITALNSQALQALRTDMKDFSEDLEDQLARVCEIALDAARRLNVSISLSQ